MVNLKKQLKRILFDTFLRKLWAQIAIVLILALTIPLILLGTRLIKTSQRAVKNSVLSGHKQIVIQASKEIEIFVKNPEQLLESVSAILGMAQYDAWKQETILVEMVLRQPIFLRASTIDSAGNGIASSDLGSELESGHFGDVLQIIKKGAVYKSQIKMLGNNVPYMTMAAPIYKGGKINGALVADINLRGLWKIVDDIRLGKTGRAFLVSKQGRLLAHQDKKKVLKNENLKKESDVSSVISGDIGVVELKDASGKDLVSAYAPLTSLGWGLILRQERDEAYLYLSIMKAQSWITIILSIVILVFLSILIARISAKTISNLVSKIKTAVMGSQDERIKLKRCNELSELMKSFNDIKAGLKRVKAREQLSIIGESTNKIAHEFKNSLASVKIFTQLLPRRYKDKEFIYKFNRIVPEGIKQCESILKEMSDCSAPVELNMINTNIKSILDNLLFIMEEQFSSKRINVRNFSVGDGFCTLADPKRIKQVFMNLLINAVNSMPDGGTLFVSIKTIVDKGARDSSQIEIVFEDTGRGIPKELLEKVFEPFFTTKEGGMGLGLAISRDIIEKHSGSISAESIPGKGTIFTIQIPVKIQIKEESYL